MTALGFLGLIIILVAASLIFTLWDLRGKEI